MSPTDLGRLLDEASSGLPEADLAGTAWEAAVRRRARQRRAVLGGVAGVGVAALVTAGVVYQDRQAEQPRPAATSPAPTPVGDVFPDGTPYVLGPRDGQESRLRQLATYLPTRLDWTATTTRLSTRLSGGRTGIDRVVLVYLREQREGLTPVLVTSEGEQVEVDSLRLRWLRTEQGSDLFPAPGPATIAPDGRHLVFAQPGEVVVLDVATAGVTRIPLPGAALMDAGWTTARTGIVARVSETQGWFIEADTWTAETGGARERYPAHYRLDLADGKGRLQTWDANGRLTSTTSTGVRLAATPGRSQTVGNVDGWAARAVALVPDTRETNLGVLAVQADRPSNRRFLVIPQGPRSQECCAPMGWVGGQTLLVQVVDEAQTWILAWDLTTGEVRKVTQITGGPPYAATAVASR